MENEGIMFLFAVLGIFKAGELIWDIVKGFRK